jgi:hypothetical protein
LRNASKLARLLSGARSNEESVMKSFIGAALVVGAFMLAISIDPVAAAPQARSSAMSGVTDFSAHRQVRRHYGHDRPYYQPQYYMRPVFYRPYPYASPAPFTFGIGFGPLW